MNRPQWRLAHLSAERMHIIRKASRRGHATDEEVRRLNEIRDSIRQLKNGKPA